MRVLVLFCGGTLVMKRNTEGALAAPEKDDAIKGLKELEPRVNELAEIDYEFIANIDSANMKPEHWDLMTGVIEKYYSEYDGFVVTHGTDTMAYTASALTFTLKNLGKPVILTGAQIPGSEYDTDARRNFVNAVRLATYDIAGVYIVFDEKIMLGAKATKISESDLDGFQTVSGPDAGKVNVELKLNDLVRPRHKGELKPMPGFNPFITVITLTPGNNPDDLIDLLDSERVKGVIVEGYGSGNIPYNHYQVFEKAAKLKAPVLVMSQCLHGVTSLKRYDVGLQALKLGVIECYDMTLEAASTKLMWALYRYPYEKIREIIHTNFAGEINITNRSFY